MEPEIKVTKIKNRWHARLYLGKKVFDEMACTEKQDIGVICKIMLRWYDKLGGTSLYANKARNRQTTIRPLVGKIFYRNMLEKEKTYRK